MRALLLVLIALAACAEAPASRLFRDEPKGLALREHEARTAYEALRDAKRFESSRVGEGGATSAYARAFRALAERLDTMPPARRRSLLRSLFRDATLPGKLYATCAFYFYDLEAFEIAIDVLSEDTRRVPSQIGSVIADVPVSTLVRAPDPRVRIDRGMTVAAWMSTQPTNLRTDIAGGYMPLRLRDENDTISAPRAPL
jgi:hypothetical protein